MRYKLLRFLVKVILKVLFFADAEGMEKLPEGAGAVVCANHRSFLDPLFIAAFSKRQLAYIAKQELFENRILGSLLRFLRCYPAKRDGSDMAVVRTSLRMLKNKEIMVIFPEGHRVKPGDMPKIHPGAFRIAMMAGVPLIPISICGKIKPFHKVHLIAGDPIDTLPYRENRPDDEAAGMIMRGIMQNIYDTAGEECRL